MAKMSAKTQDIYRSITSYVKHTREQAYEEWLGKTKDDPALRALYDEICSGVVHGYWDGRSFAALERRGLIRYYDDMQSDDWCVILVED